MVARNWVIMGFFMLFLSMNSCVKWISRMNYCKACRTAHTSCEWICSLFSFTIIALSYICTSIWCNNFGSLFNARILCANTIATGLEFAYKFWSSAIRTNYAFGLPVFNRLNIAWINRVNALKVWNYAAAIINQCCFIPIHRFCTCASLKAVNIVCKSQL